jgi:peptidoglycan/LPS O-acetylase OafA/YrhL
MDLLLIIRGLAAISVVVWHAVGYSAGLPWINIPGRTAVWVFFGISGYVIGYGFLYKRYALTGEGLRHFYVNRFLRIYPLFLLLSLLEWLTIWLVTGTSPVGWTDVTSQFLALQFNHDYVLNGVFWTLGLEIHFYLIAPILVLPLLIKDASIRRWTAAACYFGMLVFISNAVKNLGWSPDGRNIVATLPHFFTGMIGCSLVVQMKPNVLRFWGYLSGALILLLLTNWFYHRDYEIYWSICGIFLVDAMILLFILAYATFDKEKTSTSYLARGLAWMGTLSYGIYAWHAYLLTHVPWLSGHAVLLLVASITVAYLSYRLIELPAFRLKQWQSPV